MLTYPSLGYKAEVGEMMERKFGWTGNYWKHGSHCSIHRFVRVVTVHQSLPHK